MNLVRSGLLAAVLPALFSCTAWQEPAPAPAGTEPGYVEFYSDHSLSMTGLGIDVYRVIDGRETRIGRVIHGRQRGEGLVKVPAGVHRFQMRNGAALALVQATVEPGRLTPVKVYLSERDPGIGFEITTTRFEMRGEAEPTQALPAAPLRVE